jgi:hypothetical protein
MSIYESTETEWPVLLHTGHSGGLLGIDQEVVTHRGYLRRNFRVVFQKPSATLRRAEFDPYSRIVAKHSERPL